MITLENIELPEDLHWTDETEWAPVASNLEYGITGAGFFDASKKLTGRAISLAGDEQSCWLPRSTVLALQSLAAEPGKKMALLYHGNTHTVVFAPGKKPFDAQPLWQEWPAADTDIWVLRAVNLIEVEE